MFHQVRSPQCVRDCASVFAQIRMYNQLINFLDGSTWDPSAPPFRNIILTLADGCFCVLNTLQTNGNKIYSLFLISCFHEDFFIYQRLNKIIISLTKSVAILGKNKPVLNSVQVALKFMVPLERRWTACIKSKWLILL